LTESHAVYAPSVLQSGQLIFIFLNDDIDQVIVC
jgi:hypothetical protein